MKEFNDEKTKSKGVILENVHLAYVELAKAKFKFESVTDKEFSLTAIVDEDTADEYAERFPKASVKNVKTADFEGRYKFPAPFPKEKKQYMIRIACSAQGKSKEDGSLYELPYRYETRPKISMLETEKSAEGKSVIKHITLTTPIGNGTIARQIRISESANSFGNFAYLRSVLILEKDLVEYEQTERKTNNPFAEFGELDEDSVPSFDKPKEEAPKVSAPAATPAAPKEEVKAPAPNFDDFDDDIPF